MNTLSQKFLSAATGILRRYSWFPVSVFLVHEICAHGLDAYRRWPAIDIPLHFLGGMAIAYFAAGALHVAGEHRLLHPPDPRLRIVLLFGLVTTVAIFWEFAEWIADHTLGTQCQLSLGDTLLDLLMGMLGGLAYLLPALGRAFRTGFSSAPDQQP